MKLHRVRALLLKYYYITINRIDRWSDIFYWPILDIFIWGFMTVYIQKHSDLNIMNLVLGGIILWLFIWRAAQDMAVFVLEDFWSRNLYNLFTSPVMLKEIVISIMILGAVRSVLAFCFVGLLAYVLYQFSILTVGILFLGLFAAVLIMFAWALGLFISSFIMRYGSRVQILAWSIVWIIQPFSCIFYPLSALPEWARYIASVIPTTYVFENFRSLMASGTVDYFSLGRSAVIAVIFFMLSSLFFHNSFKAAKKHGLLSKNE